MKLSELLHGIAVVSATADMETEITGVCYDSRQVQPGSLFVAITGFAQDGHKYIPMAKEKGAAVVLCQTVPENGMPYVCVEDSRLALAMVGANWFDHPAEKMTMIGFTGTNGKTTSTYLLKHILEDTLGAKVGLIGTIQNMIGDDVIPTERTTPESFELQALFRRMLDAGCTHVIMEVSSHALVLNRVAGIPFTTGIFSNLTQDHLDFHKTMEAYRQAKSILFSMSKYGVINLDDPAAPAMLAEAACQTVTYSAKQPADLQAKQIGLHSSGVEFDACWQGETAHAVLQIPGTFSVYNALGVLGAALTLGVTLKQAVASLATAHGVRGRAEVVPTPGKDYTVLVDYSHTPDSLENILITVREFCKNRVIAVFGCGGDRDPIKRPIMGGIAARLSDLVVVTSDNPRTEDPDKIIAQILTGMEGTATPYTVEPNRRLAIRWAMDHAEPGDVIVLAGKGHETYQEIGHEKFHLDDREEVIVHLTEN